MRDQANSLRSLAQLRARALPAADAGPRWTCLVGGAPGCGATTLAVNAALALAQSGLRVIVIDAAEHAGAVARLCGDTPREGLHEVLASRRDLYEVLRRGPGGVQYVSGGPITAPATARSVPRLVRQLHSLERHADLLLFDVGAAVGELAQGLWSAATNSLLLTTPDPATVLGAYAALKALPPRGAPPQVAVNFADSEADGREVQRSLDQVASKFLGARLGFAGAVPHEDQVRASALHGLPLLARHAHSPFAAAIDRLAERLLLEPAAQAHQGLHQRAA